MNTFVSEYNNGKYRIGCSGGSLFVYSSTNNVMIDQIKLPYVYYGTFVLEYDVFIAKSTAGYLYRYDLINKTLEHLMISKSIQDGGFAICPWDKCFYNIEITPLGHQISKYDVMSFQRLEIIPIKGDIANAYDLEFDDDSHAWFILLSYSYNGRIKRAVVKMDNSDCVGIRDISSKLFNQAVGYKYWERCGFTQKSLCIAKSFSENCTNPIRLADLYSSDA